jgi:competence protein ComEC
MAVVAGVVFFAVRALLALIPALATGFPIKKWSATAALAAALFYLLLSGAEVATQRSFFMTAVVLIAIMVDRRAVTFKHWVVHRIDNGWPSVPSGNSGTAPMTANWR